MVEEIKDSKIGINFFTLIINAKSIEAKFKGGLKRFLNRKELWGSFNGELIVMSAMMCPSPSFNHIIESLLIPAGLKVGEDYVLGVADLYPRIHEQIKGKGDLPEIPWCEKISWLGSEIDGGEFRIWYK